MRSLTPPPEDEVGPGGPAPSDGSRIAAVPESELKRIARGWFDREAPKDRPADKRYEESGSKAVRR